MFPIRLSVSIVPSQVLTAKKLNRKFDLSIKTYFSLKIVAVHSLTYEKPKQQKNGKCKQKKQSSGALLLKKTF